MLALARLEGTIGSLKMLTESLKAENVILVAEKSALQAEVAAVKLKHALRHDHSHGRGDEGEVHQLKALVAQLHQRNMRLTDKSAGLAATVGRLQREADEAAKKRSEAVGVLHRLLDQ